MADPLEPRVLVSYPCPNCEGTGEQEQADSRIAGVTHKTRCPACINSPGFRKQEYVPLSELRDLLK